MVHPFNPEETMVHRTYETLTPEGEIAVVQRPEGKIKVVFYPTEGEHFEIVLDRKNAFDLAMEMLMHSYRLGDAEQP
jgi:hypothetical protein